MTQQMKNTATNGVLCKHGRTLLASALAIWQQWFGLDKHR